MNVRKYPREFFGEIAKDLIFIYKKNAAYYG
jgi:hypothetical protein